MSQNLPRQAARAVPHGEVVGTYSDHGSARNAVQRLSEAEFPVKELTIVGSDVRLVEQVMGVMTWANAAGRGALSGAWLGMLLALFIGLFGGDAALTAGGLLPPILFGVGLGMIWGLVGKALTRRKNSVVAQPAVIAQKYELICPPALAKEARISLARASSEQSGQSPLGP